MANSPKIVLILGGIVSAIHLVSAMVLLSSIIAWLSLEFSSVLPSSLAFVVGVPCLICSIVAILMLGLPRFTGILVTVFIILNIVIILASVALMTPFILNYNHQNHTAIGEICVECDYYNDHTTTCVDNCLDECCFTEYSAPLTRVFLSFTGVALIVSILGVIVGLLHLFYTKFRQQANRKSH